MRRVLLIAQRDYLQIVRSKGYLIGLVLLPLLIGGGIFFASVTNRSGPKEQRVAIVDRTGMAAAAVIDAWKDQDEKLQASRAGAARTSPHYSFEEVKPEAGEQAQLLALSGRVKSGELFMVLDIPSSALQPGADAKPEPVRFYSNTTGMDQSVNFMAAAVNDGLRRVRLRQLGVAESRIAGVARAVPLQPMNLLTKDPATGRISPAEKRNMIGTFAVPFFIVYLMMMVVLVGSAPQLGAVAEDKMQRVFEMLLPSTSPMELMGGKVLAATAASLTTSTVYIIGGLAVLAGMAVFGLAPLHILPWFFLYLLLDVAMLAALGVAIGSACGSPQDAQHLAWILFVPTMIPIFMATSVMQQPNGAFATAMSFVPPLTPIIMLLRQALPAGVPWWQPWLALAGVILWGIAVVWAAARIFRIGILSQGKTPKISELAQWVARG
ncbi:MAG TPA: ABC transporter permease [Bryobacteraceae bacterium]|nr:ABC transporter permease [Bryobacteraceae bacterium]